jgi:hypothetical protein
MPNKYIRINKRVNKIESLTYELLKSINFFTRYQKLCQSHIHPSFEYEDCNDITKLLAIIKTNGFEKAKKSSPKTLKFTEKINNGENLIKFYIGKLDIGLCEFQIYFNSKEDEYILGDVGGRLYPLLQYVETNNFEENRLPYPKFRTYEEFEQIFQEFALIYQDFKQAVIDSGIRSLEDIEDIIE